MDVVEIDMRHDSDDLSDYSSEEVKGKAKSLIRETEDIDIIRLVVYSRFVPDNLGGPSLHFKCETSRDGEDIVQDLDRKTDFFSVNLED